MMLQGWKDDISETGGEVIRREIQAFAERRGVNFLVHFTEAENIPLIMAHGILPRARFGRLPSAPKVNDEHRLDGRRNAVSVSIGFPNAPMFYSYRRGKPADDWAVLVLRPDILWEKDCGFCRYNAADSRTSRLELPELRSVAAFSSMFSEIPGKLSRFTQNLQPFDPTDEQAEVLVFDVIEPAYISGVAFDSEDVRWRYGSCLGGYNTHVYPPDRGLFGARSYVLGRLASLLKPQKAAGGGGSFPGGGNRHLKWLRKSEQRYEWKLWV